MTSDDEFMPLEDRLEGLKTLPCRFVRKLYMGTVYECLFESKCADKVSGGSGVYYCGRELNRHYVGDHK